MTEHPYNDDTGKLRALGEQLSGDGEVALAGLAWQDVAAGVSGEQWWPKSLFLDTGIERVIDQISELIDTETQISGGFTTNYLAGDQAVASEFAESDGADTSAESSNERLQSDGAKPTSASRNVLARRRPVTPSASGYKVRGQASRAAQRGSGARDSRDSTVQGQPGETGVSEQAEVSRNSLAPLAREASELMEASRPEDIRADFGNGRSDGAEAYREAPYSPVRSLGELAAALQFVDLDAPEPLGAPAESHPETDQASKAPSAGRETGRFARPQKARGLGDPSAAGEENQQNYGNPGRVEHNFAREADAADLEFWVDLGGDEERPGPPASSAGNGGLTQRSSERVPADPQVRQPISPGSPVRDHRGSSLAWPPRPSELQPEPELKIAHSRFGGGIEAKHSFGQDDYNEIFEALAKRLQREYRRFYGD